MRQLTWDTYVYVQSVLPPLGSTVLSNTLHLCSRAVCMSARKNIWKKHLGASANAYMVVDYCFLCFS